VEEDSSKWTFKPLELEPSCTQWQFADLVEEHAKQFPALEDISMNQKVIIV
jgi:hypothetical protein